MTVRPADASGEITSGDRFAFGKNWQKFVDRLDENRIALARDSMTKSLEVRDLTGLRFLDAGCGSGLFSLVARQLGATVESFDFDADSVVCTRWLREAYGPADRWNVEQGSVLDAGYMDSLGKFDVVYSWGVLHHTGDMWRAVELTSDRVEPGGLLVISIYNDQGGMSRIWARLKRTYNRLPQALRMPYAIAVMGVREIYFLLRALLTLRLGRHIHNIRNYAQYSGRGMSYWRDLIDWIGGYPFEVAKPEAVFDYLKNRSFVLTGLKTCGGGLACNEFVFRREGGA